MAEPKKKLSKTRTHRRRANYKVKLPATTICSNCQKTILTHRICPHCGFYKGISQKSISPTKRILVEEEKK